MFPGVLAFNPHNNPSILLIKFNHMYGFVIINLEYANSLI